jgi:hypothetical protein
VSAALQTTVLARYNLVHKKELSDPDFRETMSVLLSVYQRTAFCMHPARGYFVAWTVAEKSDAINYLDSVLTDVGERRCALAEAARWRGRKGYFDRSAEKLWSFIALSMAETALGQWTLANCLRSLTAFSSQRMATSNGSRSSSPSKSGA